MEDEFERAISAEPHEVHEVHDVDEEIQSEQLTIEKKKFFFDLRRNRSGKYLKISEKSGGRKHSIIVPENGLLGFVNIIRDMVKAEL
jgi:hypothetical protein